MSSTQTRIDKELYNQLKELAFQKHKNFRSLKIEVDAAVREYLAKHENQDKKEETEITN